MQKELVMVDNILEEILLRYDTRLTLKGEEQRHRVIYLILKGQAQ